MGHTYNPSVVCVSKAGKALSLRPAWAIDSRTLTQQIKSNKQKPTNFAYIEVTGRKPKSEACGHHLLPLERLEGQLKGTGA